MTTRQTPNPDNCEIDAQFRGTTDPNVIGALAVMDLDLLPEEALHIATPREWTETFIMAASFATTCLDIVTTTYALRRQKGA